MTEENISNKKRDRDLLKELVKTWDTRPSMERTLSLVSDAIKDKRFIDEEGKVREPFRTILILRVLGVRPVRSLLMLDYILRRGDAKPTRSDLADFLGPKFKDSHANVEIGQWLDCLEKLQLLKGYEVRPHGIKTRGFNVKELGPYLSSETLCSLLDGEEFDWSQLDLTKIIARKFSPRKKVRDLEGPERNFEPLELIENIIRSGANLKDAFSITGKVSKEIVKGVCKDMQTINKIVLDELKEVSPSVADRYLEDNPLGLVLTGKGYEGMTLKYDVIEKILFQHLSKYKIRHLSPKLGEAILHNTLRKFMISIKKRRKIAVTEVLDKIDTAIFDAHEKTLDEITRNPIGYTRKAHRFLHSAKDKMESGDIYQAIQRLQYSLSCCLTPLYLKLELLPRKDAISTISLTRNLLFPETGEITKDMVELQTKLQLVGKRLKELLAREKINMNDFQRSIDHLLSNEFKKVRVDAEGEIPEIDEEALVHDINFTIDFIGKIISASQNLVKTDP